MEKRCKEGWMAACAYYSAMIKDGMSPADAIVATKEAAGAVGVPPKKKPPFAWEAYLEEHCPDLKPAMQALRNYTKYRAEAGYKRWTARTWRMFLGKWQRIGAQALEQSVERTIANGWQGVFEPKGAAFKSAERRIQRGEPKEERRAGRCI